MKFVDTHSHIHWADFGLPKEVIFNDAKTAGVAEIYCVGTNYSDSQRAVEFAHLHDNVWASVGIHPHYSESAKLATQQLEDLLNDEKVIAIGECGLDYHYHRAPKKEQMRVLEYQIALAQQHNLPLIFHVRNAYEDIWPIVDNFKNLRGVFHCFSATQKELDDILIRGFYVGLNGIVTFSKNQEQLQAYKNLPLNRMLLETDAPYLAPVPLRGKINQPANIAIIADFLSGFRNESLQKIAKATTSNAHRLFKKIKVAN